MSQSSTKNPRAKEELAPTREKTPTEVPGQEYKLCLVCAPAYNRPLRSAGNIPGLINGMTKKNTHVNTTSRPPVVRVRSISSWKMDFHHNVCGTCLRFGFLSLEWRCHQQCIRHGSGGPSAIYSISADSMKVIQRCSCSSFSVFSMVSTRLL